MKKLNILLATILLSVMNFGCAIYHHYGAYYGKVVDAETKEPLEGAVVLAKYNTWLYASPGGPATYFLDAQEAITDKNGEFRISSLNAFAFRPLSTFNSEPSFRIFKPRFECYKQSILGELHQTIELRGLKTIKERINNTDCYIVSVPDDKMIKLIEVNNIERNNLGLEAGHVKEK